MIETHEFYTYQATLLKTVDGDTVDLKIDLGFRTYIEERCRLYGINTPEKKGETLFAAKAAEEFLKTLLIGGPLRIKTFKDKGDKYGRFLAVIYAPLSYTDGAVPRTAHYDPKGIWTPVNELMVRTGHAVKYMED